MAREGLVSGRSAARRYVTVRANRDAALAIRHPQLQPPASTATRAWVPTGVSLAAQVLRSGLELRFRCDNGTISSIHHTSTIHKRFLPAPTRVVSAFLPVGEQVLLARNLGHNLRLPLESI
jgi:hypothetical protein